MDALHGGRSVFHRVERFFVDVGGFDGGYFALDGEHLGRGLFELVFKGFFAAEGGFGDCVYVMWLASYT